MLGVNSSSLTPGFFILNGIPGLEATYIRISLPFCFMHIIAVVGNCGLICLISHEEALHRPMYYFLALLSFTDVTWCTTTVPNILCIFWLSLKEIDFNACLSQMFSVDMMTGMESGVLILMAGLATFLRSVMLIIPFTFLTKCLPYCWGNFIPHIYCDHMSVAKVSCGNFKVNAIYGLMVALLIGVFDICCISVSYTMIFQAVMSLSSADARRKAFNTGHNIPNHIHIIVANFYLLLPPTMNPVVYGVKTKHIRESMIKFLLGDKVNFTCDK
uniref:G-protein coupled receptors family 1 profile domain-containing protein n=1 Tax=Macaca nemestrina TaxID=9545 RepID=A0A2K6B684_MACNE